MLIKPIIQISNSLTSRNNMYNSVMNNYIVKNQQYDIYNVEMVVR